MSRELPAKANLEYTEIMLNYARVTGSRDIGFADCRPEGALMR